MAHGPKLALRGATSHLVTDMCMYSHAIVGRKVTWVFEAVHKLNHVESLRDVGELDLGEVRPLQQVVEAVAAAERRDLALVVEEDHGVDSATGKTAMTTISATCR